MFLLLHIYLMRFNLAYNMLYQSQITFKLYYFYNIYFKTFTHSLLLKYFF